MPRIDSITAYEVLDAEGLPAVAAVVRTENNITGQTMVSVSNAPTAIHAITTEIQAALLGRNTTEQASLDKRLLELDGTKGKKRLGTAIVWAVSLSIAKAEAHSQGLPLYLYLKQLFPSRPLALPR